MPSKLHTEGTRTVLDTEIESFLENNSNLYLGGQLGFHDKRNHYTRVFRSHNLASTKQASISVIEFTATRGPHETILIRVFYLFSGASAKTFDQATTLVYFHKGGYTNGSVNKFENSLRIVAKKS